MYYIYSIDINLGHTTTTTQDQKNFRLRFRFPREVSSSLRLALFTLCISLVSALLTGECGTDGGTALFINVCLARVLGIN